MASKKKYRKFNPGSPKQESPVRVKTAVPKYGYYQPVLQGRWYFNAAIFLFFVMATMVLYSGALRLGFFAVDDPQYVQQNPWITSINEKNLKFIFTQPYFANFSPVHLLSYMIDYSIDGPNAYVFHVSSNLWAGIVSGFVFLTALALTSNRIIALFAAGLFVVHPVHVEAVAWISSRKDLLAAAFALPSLLAYLYYRRRPPQKWIWYVLSLLLFLIASGAKLSVATFPAILLAIDYFIEKRPLARSLTDKLPYFAIALIIALRVAAAQPNMGHEPNAYILLQTVIHNFWLLTGFGSYVLYRVVPDSGNALLQAAGAVILLLIFIAPSFLRRRLPLVAAMIYWMLFSFIPSQVLSFTHPVTDRYLYFPSVAAAILIAWGLIATAQKFGKKFFSASLIILFIIIFFWTNNTLNYLAEWNDPRSVWYAAQKKSSDPSVPQNLGSYYVDLSRKFNAWTPDSVFSVKEKKRIAKLMWADDRRLSSLMAEWDGGQKGGPLEKEFQDYIRTEALHALTKAEQTKGNRVMPGIYYNKGSILLDMGDLEGARREFQATLQEAAKESFAEVLEQLTVYCYYGFGIIEYRLGNFANAKAWYEKADAEQKRYGRIWIGRIQDDIKMLEQFMNNKQGN